MEWDIIKAVYLVGFAVQAIVGAINWRGKDTKRFGARTLVLSPVWPGAVAYCVGYALQLLWRDAEFFPPKVLPPPSRGDQIDELERVIDEATAQLERL